MAERRMFAKTIIDSDAFLDMPVTARLLYYDLAMRADDDGFVNSPKKIMRMIGASQDDLSILILRKFIIPFDTGIVVIKHWKIHNYIRKDMYHETKYKEEKCQLTLDENNAYTLPVTNPLQECNEVRDESVTSPSTQVRLGKVSLGKDRLGEDRSGNILEHSAQDSVKERFEYLWNLYPNKKGKKQALAAFQRALKKGTTIDQIRDGIKAYVRYINESKIDSKYVKQGSTFFQQEAWNDDWTPQKPKDSLGSYLEEMQSW